MRILVLMMQVMGIAGQRHLDFQLLAELKYLLVNLFLFTARQRVVWMAVVLDLEVVTVTEDALVPFGYLDSLLVLAVLEGVADFATHTCTESDDAFVVLLKQVMVNTREVIVPVQVCN